MICTRPNSAKTALFCLESPTPGRTHALYAGFSKAVSPPLDRLTCKPGSGWTGLWRTHSGLRKTLWWLVATALPGHINMHVLGQRQVYLPCHPSPKDRGGSSPLPARGTYSGSTLSLASFASQRRFLNRRHGSGTRVSRWPAISDNIPPLRNHTALHTINANSRKWHPPRYIRIDVSLPTHRPCSAIPSRSCIPQSRRRPQHLEPCRADLNAAPSHPRSFPMQPPRLPQPCVRPP